MIKFQIPPDVLELTKTFCKTNYQPLVEKLGEVGVASYFNKMHLVDWTIYTPKSPRQTPELGIIHVKTCDWKYRGSTDEAWAVDTRTPLYKKPHSKEDIILTYADETGYIWLYGRLLAVHALCHWKPRHHKHQMSICRSDVSNLVEEFGK